MCQKFKGTFNWHGQVIILWNHADDSRQAYRRFMSRLAKDLGRTSGCIRRHFGNGKDNFKIELIKD